MPDQSARLWQPSDEELIRMRQMSRRGYTSRQAYEEINPPVGFDTFRATVKRYAINLLKRRMIG